METMLYEKNKLVAEIQEVLLSWVNGKPEVRSVAHLSRATGVTDSAIRRLMNGGAKISDDSIFKVLSFVFDAREFEKLYSAFDGKAEIQKWFSKNYAYLKAAPVLQEYRASSIAEEITISVSMYSVYKFVSALPGVSAAQVKDQFGARGDVDLEKLIEKELIIVKDNKLFVKDAKVKITKDQAIGMLPGLTSNFLKKDHLYNVRILEIEGVSKEGYIKMMDLYEQFLGDLTNMIKNNPGQIPVIAAGFLDTFTGQPYFEGGSDETSN